MLRAVFCAGLALSLAACGGASDRDITPEPSIEVVGDIVADEQASEDIAPAVFDSGALEGVSAVQWLNARLTAGTPIVYANPVDEAASAFVQLALHMGRLDGDYVDAYHGPKAWRVTADSMTPDAMQLADDIAGLAQQLAEIEPADDLEAIRVQQLKKLTRAMGVRLKVVRGEETVAFDTEVTDIYDEEVPEYDLTEYDAVLSAINDLLPGGGGLATRVEDFRNSLAIPEDKLQVVFDRAIAECRARTLAHYKLPEGETFRLEFVTDKTWSGYNYYQGNYESLIQINTDFPIVIDRAVDLGCHEGYPGHHVWNLFIERDLVGKRGWIEYSVNPLFGPFGPIAEGSANYGIELAFPGNEKIAFEKEVLFPLAGLNPAEADKLEALNVLTGQLSHATNEIARRLVDGRMTPEEAVFMIERYYLASPEKSEQRLRFIQKYRAYVINYNIGRDRAASWVEKAGTDQDARWGAFRQMLTQPMTPGDIAAMVD